MPWTVLLIALFLCKESWPFLSRFGVERIFSEATWSPTQGLYGMMPMLWASLGLTFGSLLIAAPLGVGTAVLGRFYLSGRAGASFRGLLVVMAGIPSVVYGLWGLVELVPRIAAWQPPGASLLAGTLILTMMILPTIALTADAALVSVPSSQWNAAAALGISPAGAILGVVLPAARSGIRVGVLLAAGRALGETMAVLMVCGNVVQTPFSLFDPVRPLTANIALEVAYAMGDHRAALFVSGLLLAGAVATLAVVGSREERVLP